MQDIKVGMVGLDTSHCEAFVKVLNYEDSPHHVPGATVVAAYPGGSELCAVSRDRVGKFTEAIRDQHGIALCDSIEELGERADAFVLHSVDGRQHLEQFRALSAFGKPVFIDKPLACSYEDARQIAELADERGIPWMSASSIRFAAGVSGLTQPGEQVGSCEAFGTMSILPDYPTYFWYGVHGADVLFSYLGTGCCGVRALHEEQMDLLIGKWDDGRIGTVRGFRFGQYHFGCSVFTDKGTRHAETLEVMAFLDAAGQSLARGGETVELPH